jgi:hypothetical protein
MDEITSPDVDQATIDLCRELLDDEAIGSQTKKSIACVGTRTLWLVS